MTGEAILIVEDEAIVALDLKLQLHEHGYDVMGIASSGEQALALARDRRPDLVLMDVRLQGEMDGIATARALAGDGDEGGVPVIFLTAHSDPETVQRAAGVAPYGYLTKPYQSKELRAGIEVALAKARQERPLRASEQRFRRAFDGAPLGMALVSFGGEFLQFNDALCRLLGGDAAALRAAGDTALTLQADRAHEQQRLHELQQAGHGVVQFEKRYRVPGGGEPVWTLVSASLLHESGRPTCYLYQVNDLTAQKQAAERLAALTGERVQREASEMANTEKNRFLARIGDEMRTPLNAVIGFAQLLENPPGADPVVTESYARHIRAAGEHLLVLVNDVLDLQHAAQAGLKPPCGPLRLADVVRQAVVFLQGQAGAHGVVLIHEVPATLSVLADATRLRQVLLNLGSNGIKYNRQGGRVVFTAAPGAPGRTLLQVRDDGIGMTPEQLARLHPLPAHPGAARTAVPGAGLGLTVARSLVAEMGGTMQLESRPRGGTTVTLDFASAP